MQKYKRTKHACYYTYLATSSVFSLPPLLFMTFRQMYGISYTLLGTLVLVNYCTQLTVDLIFTFLARRFNIKATIKAMPLLCNAGLLIYALAPAIFPGAAYAGLLAGTIIFSVAAGLCEVLLSPLVAALPSDNPKHDMSLLHSLYAYGVLTVVIISTAYIKLIGAEYWMYLAIFWAMLPVASFILFCISPIPEIDLTQNSGIGKKAGRTGILAICALCIFLGSASENAMTNWISVFIERSLGIPKVWGDLLGMAMFAVLLGITRSVYAKYGKNITKTLLLGMAGAAICYIVAGLSPVPFISMLACIFTGICTSMLWPGTLLFMEEQLPFPGVAAYALMAAGGDLGGSVAPQLLGIVVDNVAVSDPAAELGAALSISAEQVGMKTGMLVSALFPIMGVALLIYSVNRKKRRGGRLA